MDSSDAKGKRNHRGGSLFSGLICGGKEAAAASGVSATVEEGRKTENQKGDEKVKISINSFLKCRGTVREKFR